MAKSRSTRPAKWLLGTWRSDKKRTLSELIGSAKFKRIMRRELGRLRFRYRRRRVFCEFYEQRYTTPYRVLWENENSLFLISGPKEDESGQLIIRTLRAPADR
jgi:hypothetical protein